MVPADFSEPVDPDVQKFQALTFLLDSHVHSVDILLNSARSGKVNTMEVVISS